MNSIAVSLLFLVSLQLTYACYITNCPIGGKRSLASENRLRNHQCPRCGLNGQCFGSSICCDTLGCRLGHPIDIRQCSIENQSMSPCTTNGLFCSAVANGRCASRGICCNTESCHVDETCSMHFSPDSDESRGLSS